MKKLSTILCTLALLFGAVGGVSSVKATKTIGTKYTSVEQLSGKAFAIVNETDGKAIYHKGTPSPFTLGYDVYNTAFSVTETGYKFIIEQVNDPNDPAANGKYLLRCVTENGSVYDNNYFQTNSSDESFIFALNFGGSQRGLDGANTAVWDIEYNAIAGGWSLKNVGKNGYLNDPTKGATNASPAYFTFCEVKEKEVVDQNVEISVGGETRNFQLYVPDKDMSNCPLVISLHGAYGHSTDYSPFRKAVADEANCIVAYPQGKVTAFPIGFGGSGTGWTATGENNFDVEFLKAVIEDVASKYQIDRKRIYCCGFSNGGMMTYAMANACSDEIAAFAAISGYPINEFHLRHTGDRPVPFLHIHGKADDFVKYSLVPTIVDEMVARLGANPVPTTTTGSGYTKKVYAAADGSFPYVFYEIDGMDHSDFTANTEDGSSAKTMWNFFKQYTLDSPSDATLKWAPRIETAGFVPASHGWTVNDGTTLLQFGGDQSTNENQNVYHSLQLDNGNYKLSFKSTGAAGKTIGVKIEKLTSPNTVVLDETVNVGVDAELPFTVTDGWGEYKLTITRPDASDAITVTNLAITQTDNTTPVANNHYRLYASKLSTDGTNAVYENGKLKWTSTSNNVAGAITADAGVIAKFSSIHFTCSALTPGATYRVMLTTSGNVNYLTEINATGDVTVNFSDLIRQWGSDKLTPEILETVTQVRIGGGTGGSPSAGSPYEMTMDVSSFYIESEEDQFSIANTSDWVIFSKMVKAGVSPLDAQLTADVDAGSTMVGTDADGKRYTGTFAGAGHTLTFTYNGGEQFVAPFRSIEDATITDLLTTGSITTSSNMPSGLVGKNVGNSTLTRCGSSMSVTTTDSGNGRIGGLVGRCADGNQMTFNNCMYDGAISTATSGYACGFVGWDNQANKITLNNCLVASTSITGGGKNFINNTPIIPEGKYAIYTTKFGSSSQGTQATAAQLATGELAYTLNNGITDGVLFFGQGKLNSSTVEATPTLTSMASKKVYKAQNESLFANADGLLPDPALSGKLAWKMAMTWDPIYFVTLPAANANNYNLYGSADSYILKVSAAGATTLVVPFNLAAEKIPEGMKVYDLTFDGTTITATKVNSITANKPVLINAPQGEYRLESGIDPFATLDFSTYTSTTNGALTGVYNTTLPYSYVPAGAYVLQNAANGLGFYQVENENTIKITSFRAYLTAPSSARMINIVYTDNETTAISEVEDKTDGDASIHSLSGQLVKKAAKGIYVKNGKKVIIK